jgi:hypothetical protein
LSTSTDCGRDAHEHVRQANHRNNGGSYFGDKAGFLAFHRERRLVATAQVGLETRTHGHTRT